MTKKTKRANRYILTLGVGLLLTSQQVNAATGFMEGMSAAMLGLETGGLISGNTPSPAQLIQAGLIGGVINTLASSGSNGSQPTSGSTSSQYYSSNHSST